MHPSSDLCRAQEVAHRERAAGAQLENVRRLAEKAAMAWGREAVAAERREARYAQRQAIATAPSMSMADVPDGELVSFSENPDRGLADD